MRGFYLSRRPFPVVQDKTIVCVFAVGPSPLPSSPHRRFDLVLFQAHCAFVRPPPAARLIVRFCCDTSYQVVHTPGHSLGSITLLYSSNNANGKPSAPGRLSGEDEGVAFTGDHLGLSGRTGALTGFPRCKIRARFSQRLLIPCGFPSVLLNPRVFSAKRSCLIFGFVTFVQVFVSPASAALVHF